MLNPAIDDVGLFHSFFNCIDGAADFGNHPSLKDSRFDEFFRFARVQTRDETPVTVQYPWYICEQN